MKGSSPDDDTQILLSPVGNKINMFDLRSNVARTLPFQSRGTIERLVLSPDNKTLLVIDRDGYALIINFEKLVVISHFNFHGEVTACEFSPDCRFFAVATGHKLKIFEAPNIYEKTYAPLLLYKKYGNLH